VSAFFWREGEVQWVDANEQRLEAAVWGPAPADAPTLVMLHEGLGSLAHWKDFPKTLAESTGFGVLAYSRAGYGWSSAATLPRPLDYMTREATECLPRVLDAVGFRRGVILGHSDGATIAAIHAGTMQDFRVRGVCLMAPHFFTEPQGLSAIADAKVAFESGDLREKLARYHADPVAAFRGWNDAWLDPAFAEWNVEKVISYLRVPVLAIQGRDDPYGSLAQLRALDEGAYSPVELVVLDGCGHAPHRECPEDTVAAISDFLVRLEALEAEPVAVG